MRVFFLVASIGLLIPAISHSTADQSFIKKEFRTIELMRFVEESLGVKFSIKRSLEDRQKLGGLVAGLTVSEVIPGGLAAKAGMKSGDFFPQVNKVSLGSYRPPTEDTALVAAVKSYVCNRGSSALRLKTQKLKYTSQGQRQKYWYKRLTFKGTLAGSAEGHPVCRSIEAKKIQVVKIQQVPHGVGETLYIDSRFAIHASHWLTAHDVPLCKKPPGVKTGYLNLIAVLNAPPDYRITKDWLWSEFRPALEVVVNQRCPGQYVAKVGFKYRGIDIEYSTKEVSALVHTKTGGTATIALYKPYRIDDFKYPMFPKLVGKRLELLSYLQPSSSIVIAATQFSNIKGVSGSSHYKFSPNFFDADGSFVGYLKARRDYTRNQLGNIQESNQEIAGGVKLFLGMMAAWECSSDYHDWCSGISGTIGSLQAPNIDVELE